MTEPTDAELIALLGDRQFSTIGAVREALRRWGAPPAVAGEPIGHLYCGGSYGDELADWEIVADQHQCDKLNEHHGALGKEAKLPIYAAQQPTQVQAGAVPLTLRWCAHCGEGVTNFCRSKPAGDCPIGLPRIKGGQHVGKVD